jgi:hypothetical protein
MPMRAWMGAATSARSFLSCNNVVRPRLSPPSIRRVDSVSAGPITVLVMFFRRTPSTVSQEGAECGARQLASRWSAGRRRALRTGPRPGTPTPSERTWVPESWRGPADRKAGRGAIASSPAPPGAPTPRVEGKGRASPAARKVKSPGGEALPACCLTGEALNAPLACTMDHEL